MRLSIIVVTAHNDKIGRLVFMIRIFKRYIFRN